MYQKLELNWTQYVYVTFIWLFLVKLYKELELTYILTQNQNVSKIGVESNTICICDIQLQFLIHFTWLNCIKNRSWLLHILTQNVSKIGAKLITICICIYVCVTFNSNFWYILFSNTRLFTELQDCKLLQKV